jgi:lipopolysaccharide/colanic/teichoic acid biosynthesis glycosyltransferase
MEDFIKLNDFEKSAYSLSPGITDFSSIVFSDEGNILKGQKNADVTYNRVIRPWKSRLVLLYMHSASINADTIIIFATALSLLKKRWALNVIYKLAVRQRASLELLDLIKRKGPVPIVQPPTKIKDVIK